MSHRNQISFLILFFIFLLSFVSMYGQIPNNGFENWASGEPDGWTTTNIPPDMINVTQTSNAHSGLSAVHGEVVSVGGMFTFNPVLLAGKIDTPGFPVNQQYAALHGYYKFTSLGGDYFYVSISFKKGTTAIGAGGFSDSANVTTWREFVAPIYYPDPTIPDTAYITIMVTPTVGASAGTNFDLDDLSFGPATGVNDRSDGKPKIFQLEQNFPNPFNPSTLIAFSIPTLGAGDVNLAVYDVTGKLIHQLVQQYLLPGNYLVRWDGISDAGKKAASGVYYYRMQLGNHVEAKPMLMMK